MEFPVVDLLKTGQNINRLREQHKLSVKQLQQLMGLSSPQAIYKWQHGICLPSVDNLMALAAIFSVHIVDILVTLS